MSRATGIVGIDDYVGVEGELVYIHVDKKGKVLIADEDVERIADLVAEKLKEKGHKDEVG